MRRASILLLALAPAVWLTSCPRNDGGGGPDGKVRVAVSIQPQAYFVDRVGGEHVEVDVLVGPGQHPHTFDPTIRQMRRLRQTRLYFRIGVPFEQTLCQKLTLAHKRLRIVDMRRGIRLRAMAHHHHDDGPHGEGHGGELDPHIWLSPPLAKIQAKTVCDELCTLDGDHEADYRANLAALHGDLDRLHAQIARDLAPLKGRTFYSLHPAFGYFAAAYGLKQEAVETEGKAPGLKHIRELLKRARAGGVSTIFVQPQFSARQARTLAAELGGSVVPIDPLAYDYLKNLQDISQKVQQALTAGADGSGGT